MLSVIGPQCLVSRTRERGARQVVLVGHALQAPGQPVERPQKSTRPLCDTSSVAEPGSRGPAEQAVTGEPRRRGIRKVS